MAVVRKEFRGGHVYTVDGARVPGVTTVLNKTIPKPALIHWAANTTAAYAVDRWDELAEMTPSQRLDLLKKARDASRDDSARRGTEFHRLAAEYQQWAEMDVPTEHEGRMRAWDAFLGDCVENVIVAEAAVANRAIRYAGTFDLVARMTDGHVWLLDIKTGKDVYPEMAIQLAAYRYAEVYVHPTTGEELAMDSLAIERTGLVHVTESEWRLYPTDSGPDTFNYFRHLMWLYSRADDT